MGILKEASANQEVLRVPWPEDRDKREGQSTDGLSIVTLFHCCCCPYMVSAFVGKDGGWKEGAATCFSK